jgi:sulfate/thiosulfate transport system ATP-binding protein
VRNRGIGFVFQHYALFRHMTVFDNVAFGLRVKDRKLRPSEAEIRAKVHSLLELVQLDWLHNRYPDQLSGGQRQRIALARALAVEPSVLLLDEPFGALDASVRKDLRQWLRHLHDELDVTSIFVTHDQEEAMEVASRIVVLNHGRIEQQGTPDEIYQFPANAFVSRFIGQTNVIAVDRNDPAWLQAIGLYQPETHNAAAHVRPHDIELRLPDAPDGGAATVKNWQHLGGTIRVELQKPLAEGNAEPIYTELPYDQFKQLQIVRGTPVALRIKQAQWFNEN